MRFGLIHGGLHDEACWTGLQESLGRRSHEARAVRLPIEDATGDLDRYANTVAQTLHGWAPFVLVGHSMGAGVALELDRRTNLQATLLLCPAITFAEHDASEPAPAVTIPEGVARLGGDGLIRIAPDDATTYFYHDCPPDVLAFALRHVRPQSAIGARGPQRAARTRSPSAVIQAESDRCVNPEWSVWAAEVLTGRQAWRLEGGHSPFYTRPDVLAETLIACAASLIPHTGVAES